jgi:hypothetical protein
VDVNLHTGRWTFEQAVKYFMEAGGLDRESAEGEAAGAAASPSQKITYMVGKWQIMRLLGRYRDRHAADFSVAPSTTPCWQTAACPSRSWSGCSSTTGPPWTLPCPRTSLRSSRAGLSVCRLCSFNEARAWMTGCGGGWRPAAARKRDGD